MKHALTQIQYSTVIYKTPSCLLTQIIFYDGHLPGRFKVHNNKSTLYYCSGWERVHTNLPSLALQSWSTRTKRQVRNLTVCSRSLVQFSYYNPLMKMDKTFWTFSMLYYSNHAFLLIMLNFGYTILYSIHFSVMKIFK